MTAENYITASCVISNHRVYKNGELLFSGIQDNTAAFLAEVYQHFSLVYTRFYKMDNLSKLGWLASEVLLKDSLNKEDYLPAEIGMVLANANASLDSDIKYMASVADIPSPSLFVYTLPNIMTGEISIRNNFKGEAAFFISETFDAAFVEQYVNTLLNDNLLKACLCGWVDILADEYKACLFLVEKRSSEMCFDKAQMNKIFDKIIDNNE